MHHVGILCDQFMMHGQRNIKERMDEIIQDDRRVTVDTIARTLGIGHNAVQEMNESLGYRKVCARWVPRL